MNYFANPYQGYGSPYGYPSAAPQGAAGAPQAFGGQVTRVNGRNGADAFRMAPNSSILLMDENDPIVWLKKTDGAGYATVTPYTVTPYQAAAILSNSVSQAVSFSCAQIVCNFLISAFAACFATIYATNPEIRAQPIEINASFIFLPQKQRAPFSQNAPAYPAAAITQIE